MAFSLQFYSLQSPIDDILNGLENWCLAFNEFAVIFFGYIKYILVFILFAIGIFTLLRFRGIYRHSRLKGNKNKADEYDRLYKTRLVVGTFYIVLASGILLNWFTYFLIIVLEPLPDRLIFNFINFNGDIDPFLMNRIMDINSAVYPHEKTIYYCVALASFGAFIDVVVSIWYLIVQVPQNPKRVFGLLIGGVTTGILTGFTTCLPFFV